MISWIFKVEVGVISRRRRLRQITLTKTLIVLDTSQKPNLIIVLLYIKRKKMVTTVRGTDNLFLILWKYLTFSQFFLFHVISEQLLCHLRRPFCALWVLVFNYFFDVLLGRRSKPGSQCFWFFADGKQKARELDMITLRNHAPRSYMTWLSVTLSVLDAIIV